MTKHFITLNALLIFVVLTLIYFTSSQLSLRHDIGIKITELEKQIALDLPLLELPNEFLHYSGDQAAVSLYIEKLNQHLSQQYISVVNISSKPTIANTDETNQLIRQLNSPNQVTYITLSKNIPFVRKVDIAFMILFAFVALIMSYWRKKIIEQSKKYKINVAKNNELADFKLCIDLQTKTLSSNYVDNLHVGLANKPLCFYLALADYCIMNNDVILNQNKDVPEDLIKLANKYFYRLTELGHTIRKRPNFNNSLDKTLSEIRAALDEVLAATPEYKEIYYPPKAAGEGSRSRVHSYALNNLIQGQIRVKGK
ncbi:hypothetical protein J8L70_10705 [Pseudoalteromonas sp. MMG010]|uniref:hypothetical protein n=1 Tax=Pseudoalteromonas sp. MMG010 TaxID=2822685 RepID=UPI001B3A54EA|nr:hypothetical protein [Pseudoalteromonas sp. MMG010]MBQ4833712.1 hypothetical protein [Pseudoalteromonas sp. MMG010]